MEKKKPAVKKNASSDSLMGWFGRQVGHVKKAVQTDVTKATAKKRAPAKPSVKPVETILYRHDEVQQVIHPEQPGMILRRTTIDEVVVNPHNQDEKPK